MRISSKSRARAFLWLCYHYHEAPSPNPFSDANSEGSLEKVPPFVHFTDVEAKTENIDTPEEYQRGLDMTDLRRRFLETKPREEFSKDPEGGLMRPQASGPKGRGKGEGRVLAETGSVLRMREASPTDSQYSVPLSFRDEDMLEGTSAVTFNSHVPIISQDPAGRRRSASRRLGLNIHLSLDTFLCTGNTLCADIQIPLRFLVQPQILIPGHFRVPTSTCAATASPSGRNPGSIEDIPPIRPFLSTNLTYVPARPPCLPVMVQSVHRRLQTPPNEVC